jgi:hypothetical protein
MNNANLIIQVTEEKYHAFQVNAEKKGVFFFWENVEAFKF